MRMIIGPDEGKFIGFTVDAPFFFVTGDSVQDVINRVEAGDEATYTELNGDPFFEAIAELAFETGVEVPGHDGFRVTEEHLLPSNAVEQEFDIVLVDEVDQVDADYFALLQRCLPEGWTLAITYASGEGWSAVIVDGSGDEQHAAEEFTAADQAVRGLTEALLRRGIAT